MLGISILALYSLGKILSFVGINQGVYGAYFLFYILLVISISVLPNDYPS